MYGKMSLKNNPHSELVRQAAATRSIDRTRKADTIVAEIEFGVKRPDENVAQNPQRAVGAGEAAVTGRAAVVGEAHYIVCRPQRERRTAESDGYRRQALHCATVDRVLAVAKWRGANQMIELLYLSARANYSEWSNRRDGFSHI